MLLLQLKSGEYLTIGEEITIQVFRENSSRIRVAVQAPKDMNILRGEVLERNGTERPGGLIDQAVPNRTQKEPQVVSSD